ncbi:MAG: PCRF domain-containing protein, partial [bacterium]
MFELDKKSEQLKQILSELSEESTWKNVQHARVLQQKKSELEGIIDPFNKIAEREQYLEQSLAILDEEEGALFVGEISKELKFLAAEIERLELKHLLSGPHDRSNAIVEIHPGAGGTESQDWAQMLLRMYLKWAEKNGYQPEV